MRTHRTPKFDVYRLSLPVPSGLPIASVLAAFLLGCHTVCCGNSARAFEPIERLPTVEAGYSEFHAPPEPAIGSISPWRPLFSPAAANYADDPLLPDEPWMPPASRLKSHKDGFFQKLSFSGTWLNGDRDDDLGLTELKLFAIFALPLLTHEHPLLVSPNFETRLLHGPLTPDLPGQVYSAYLQLIWVPKLSLRWTGILGFEPGLYSDFQDGDDDALRILGRGLLKYEWVTDRVQLLFGVLYLDRDDVNLLPAGGIIWTPSEDLHLEILFPRPKLARRISWNGHAEQWVYLAGEFGGDTWAIQREAGFADRLTLRDLRVSLGLERKRDGGAGAMCEVGYVFGRTLQYQSATPTLDLPDTIMLRAGVTY
jgi:hypothetical protein